MTFSILTLGCKVNLYESEAVINDLISKGWTFKDFKEECDVYIINTCTVTQTSDQKSRQMLSRARRQNEKAIIVAMGCFAQLSKESAMNFADIVVGNNNKMTIYDKVNEFITSKKQIEEVLDIMHKPAYEEMKISSLNTHTRGFIKIQDGCENFCTYCAIPYSRGNLRSRDKEEVIQEINKLVETGTKEVILAGINTGAYGKEKGYTFRELIEEIMTRTNLYRLRISSIELKEITDELLNTLKKYENRIAHHFHIPLQAGVDSVLKRMGRKYNAKEYLDMISKVRELFPGCAITTDLLAGFVGETEEEFALLKEYIQKVNYYEMHIFPYSRRKGTVADSMEGHLDNHLKQERARELISIASEMKLSYMKEQIGKTFDIIVETNKDGFYRGHSSNYLDIYFKSDNDLKEGMIVNVMCEKITNGKLYGKEEK